MDACLPLPLPMNERVPPAATAPRDDAELVRRAAAGDLAAFEALYRAHAARVHGLMRRLAGRCEALAEDLTQEAFVRAWQKLPGFRRECAFSTWLHRLAVNVALMHLRQREPVDAAVGELSPAIGAGDSAWQAGQGAELARAVARLPMRARAVLVLHDVEGWKHAEIAAELGIAVGSCKAHLHRARSLLRTLLGEPVTRGGDAR